MQRVELKPPALFIPVGLQCPNGPIEGYAERLDEFGALVQSLGAVPTAGQECSLELHLPLGQVRIQVRVLGIDPAERQFEVEFLRFEENSRLLLAALLLQGNDDDPVRQVG